MSSVYAAVVRKWTGELPAGIHLTIHIQCRHAASIRIQCETFVALCVNDRDGRSQSQGQVLAATYRVRVPCRSLQLLGNP
jgi:hypothetical protein